MRCFITHGGLFQYHKIVNVRKNAIKMAYVKIWSRINQEQEQKERRRKGMEEKRKIRNTLTAFSFTCPNLLKCSIPIVINQSIDKLVKRFHVRKSGPLLQRVAQQLNLFIHKNILYLRARRVVIGLQELSFWKIKYNVDAKSRNDLYWAQF